MVPVGDHARLVLVHLGRAPARRRHRAEEEDDGRAHERAAGRQGEDGANKGAAQLVVDEIKALTANWKKSNLPRPKVPAAAMPEKFTEKVLTMPEAAQLAFYMGHPGIKRDNPDYYKLLVMDYVLGTGPGFTDRLSAKIRDREGLAYTVNANITNGAGEEPGLFTCYVGTEPRHFAKVKKMFLEEVDRIRTEAPLNRPVRMDGLVEVPITWFEDYPGHTRALQVCAASTADARGAPRSCQPRRQLKCSARVLCGIRSECHALSSLR